jgi:hypothetical protein
MVFIKHSAMSMNNGKFPSQKQFRGRHEGN